MRRGLFKNKMKMIPYILLIIGIFCIVSAFVVDENQKKGTKVEAVESNHENTENWTEAQFTELFDSVFKEINEPVYYHERTKFHVRYTPDLAHRQHIFHEMYDTIAIYEWIHPMFNSKQNSIDRFMNLKFALINEMLVTHSMHLQQAINEKKDKDLMERIEKLNK